MKSKIVRTDDVSIHPDIEQIIYRLPATNTYIRSNYTDEVSVEEVNLYLMCCPPIAIEQHGEIIIVARIDSLMIARHHQIARITVMVLDNDPIKIYITNELHGPLIRGCRHDSFMVWNLIKRLRDLNIDAKIVNASNRRLSGLLNIDRRKLK